MITANRVYNFVADDPHVMHKWISALSPRKMSAFESQQREDWLEKGTVFLSHIWVLYVGLNYDPSSDHTLQDG